MRHSVSMSQMSNMNAIQAIKYILLQIKYILLQMSPRKLHWKLKDPKISKFRSTELAEYMLKYVSLSSH